MAEQTLTTYITTERVGDLVGFVKEAFGATELLRARGSAGGDHIEVAVGDSKLMMGGVAGMAARREEMPTSLHMYVENADEVYARALDAGAESLYAPVDQFYGDREAGVQDPAGNIWYIATNREGPNFVREGLRTVTPFLHVRDAASMIEFLKKAFGAAELSREESEGAIRHAVVRIGESAIEIGEAHGQWQPMATMFVLQVDDVDGIYRRLVEAGAESLEQPADQPYGARRAGVKDPFGNQWYLSMPIRK